MLVLLSRGFAGKDALVNSTPKTFSGWHGAGFRLFWLWKSRPGQPPVPMELRRLVREMALSNLSWSEERIANELLLKLGIWISPRTVRKYMHLSASITFIALRCTTGEHLEASAL